MKTIDVVHYLFAATLAFTGCGSEGAKIGESCATEGALIDECGDGAVCSRNVGDTVLVCHQLCEKDDECTGSEKPPYSSEQLNEIEGLWRHLEGDYFSRMLVADPADFVSAV